MYNRTTLYEGGDKGKKNPSLPPQDENVKFGNWTGQTDTKVMAKDLMDRGLVGANQLMADDPTTNPTGISNSQSDWKQAAIQNILANAHKFNIRTPEAVLANQKLLIGNPKWEDAINNQYFKNIHPNFWEVVTHSLLPERWK